MLIVTDKEYFAEVYQWAIEQRYHEELDKSLVYLHTYGGDWADQNGWQVELGRDWAAHSFSLLFRRTGENAGNPIYGGLIFHEGSNHWGVHT